MQSNAMQLGKRFIFFCQPLPLLSKPFSVCMQSHVYTKWLNVHSYLIAKPICIRNSSFLPSHLHLKSLLSLRMQKHIFLFPETLNLMSLNNIMFCKHCNSRVPFCSFFPNISFDNFISHFHLTTFRCK